MKMFFENESRNDFSNKHDEFIDELTKTVEPMGIKQNEESKAKVLKKINLEQVNHPYFIQKFDMTLDPINTMDCIRIFDKIQELDKEPDSNPTLYSPIHYCTINLKE